MRIISFPKRKKWGHGDLDPDQQVSPNVALSCSASRILRSNYHIIAQAPKDLVLRKPTANWQSIFQTLPMKEKVLLELQRAWICILAHYCTARLCDDPIVGLIRLANIIKEILGPAGVRILAPCRAGADDYKISTPAIVHAFAA